MRQFLKVHTTRPVIHETSSSFLFNLKILQINTETFSSNNDTLQSMTRGTIREEQELRTNYHQTSHFSHIWNYMRSSSSSSQYKNRPSMYFIQTGQLVLHKMRLLVPYRQYLKMLYCMYTYFYTCNNIIQQQIRFSIQPIKSLNFLYRYILKN